MKSSNFSNQINTVYLTVSFPWGTSLWMERLWNPHANLHSSLSCLIVKIGVAKQNFIILLKNSHVDNTRSISDNSYTYKIRLQIDCIFSCESLFVFKNSISPETGKVWKVQSINSNDFDITFASINVNTNWSVQQIPHYTVTLKVVESFYNYEKETSNLFF